MTFDRVAARVRAVPPLATDLAVVAVVGLFTASDVAVNDPGYRQDDALTWALLAVSLAALVFRRRRPVPVACVTGAACAGWALHGHIGELLNLPVIVALYTVAVLGDRRRTLWTGLVAATVSGVVALIVGRDVVNPQGLPVLEMVWPLVPLLLGEAVRTRRELLAEYAARAERAEEEREREAARRDTSRRASGSSRVARVARVLPGLSVPPVPRASASARKRSTEVSCGAQPSEAGTTTGTPARQVATAARAAARPSGVEARAAASRAPGTSSERRTHVTSGPPGIGESEQQPHDPGQMPLPARHEPRPAHPEELLPDDPGGGFGIVRPKPHGHGGLRPLDLLTLLPRTPAPGGPLLGSPGRTGMSEGLADETAHGRINQAPGSPRGLLRIPQGFGCTPTCCTPRRDNSRRPRPPARVLRTPHEPHGLLRVPGNGESLSERKAPALGPGDGAAPFPPGEGLCEETASTDGVGGQLLLDADELRTDRHLRPALRRGFRASPLHRAGLFLNVLVERVPAQLGRNRSQELFRAEVHVVQCLYDACQRGGQFEFQMGAYRRERAPEERRRRRATPARRP